MTGLSALESLGIIPIQQPMAYGPPSVNLYLGLGPPPFLIDTGLPPGGGWDIGPVVFQHGVDPADLAQAFLTHAHVDHAGAARQLKEQYGTRIFAHPAEAPRLDGRQAVFFLNELPQWLSRFGLAKDKANGLMKAVRGPVESYRRQVLDGVEALEEGMRLPVEGADLRVIHTPGHSRGGVCFFEQRTRALFTGDTLPSNGPPRALISPDDERTVRFDGIGLLESSLNRLKMYEPAVVFPGHGRPSAFKTSVEAALEGLAEIRENAAAGLSPEGVTVLDLSGDMDSRPPVSYLMHLGETRAALEALLTSGRAGKIEDGPVERFYPA